MPAKKIRVNTRPWRLRSLVAWPTFLVLTLSWCAIALSWWAVIVDAWPLWLACVVNSIAGYALFTPAHEAIHRAASTSPRINDAILAASLFVAIPFSKGRIFRVMHLKHHRFANDQENDPDHWLVKSLWRLPLWGLWPYFYLYRFFRNPQDYPNIKRNEVIRELVVAAFSFAALIAFGPFSPFELLVIWVIPTYVAFFLMCLVFMGLPHYPGGAKEADNPYATAYMRMGKEWLLTPLLMHQNYHLIHHLYPTIPFYRYHKVWYAYEAYHHEKAGQMIIGPWQLGQS